MSITLIIIIILIVLLIGVLPTWPHAATWGHSPATVIAAVLIVLLILALMGKI